MESKTLTDNLSSSNLDISNLAEKTYEPNEKNRLQRSMHVAKRAVQSTVITLELLPTNEAIRFGALGIAIAKTDSPVVGAAVLGGTTLLVEGAAALATADLIASDKSNKAISWVNSKLEKYVPPEAKMSPVTEAGVAMVGGSVVVIAEKQREDPSRTASQNRRHGVFTASWMAGVFAVEGAAIANGIEDYHDPKSVGLALIAVGGLAAATKWARNKLKKKTT